jgi:acetyltransferase
VPPEPAYAHLAIHPYPAISRRRVQLADGSWLEVRPIRPRTPESRWRFVSALVDADAAHALPELASRPHAAMLARFTQIDYDREMALIAVRERPASSARWRGALHPAARRQIVRVRDRPRGRSGRVAGSAAGLMRSRSSGSRANRGLETMVGWVFASNTGMLRLCTELGFRIEPEPDDPSRAA